MIATGSVSVYRGASVDSYGDEVSSRVVVATGLPISIHVSTLSKVDADSGKPYSVNYISALVYGNDIRVGDRLRDEGADVKYVVENVTLSGPFVHGVTRLSLRYDNA